MKQPTNKKQYAYVILKRAKKQRGKHIFKGNREC